MKGMFKPRVALAIALLLMACTGLTFYRQRTRQSISADTILLLLPDALSENDIQVQVWLDAAREEGLHLRPVHDSTLLDPMFQTQSVGLIVPDEIHREANDALIGALHRYVEQGGKLMVVYDACTWDLHDHYATHASRLSDLVGVDYALYDRFGTESIVSGKVWGTSAAMRALAIPPGSYIPEKQKLPAPASPLRQVALHSGARQQPDRQVLAGYLYGELEYPSFQTAGAFHGHTFLQSETGIVAGEARHGAGDVLFVNLPLGYLVTRTDGLLLHSFLRYFAIGMLRVPFLASVPDGVGGLVMNWHIDAESALKPMAALRRAGIFAHGPFSTDFTTGPDVDEFRDGKGLDLSGNAEAQSWVRFLLEHGDEVGSHGGWIHNYFGKNVSDENEGSFTRYLSMNLDSLKTVSNRPIEEYSAPMGNQPSWVTHWLEKNHVVAYYFSGDAGMGPTRVYRDKGREGDQIWAFPILHFGTEACLEEMSFDSVPSVKVRNWLFDVVDFAARSHQARLIYSHPIGAIGYIKVLQSWFEHADALASEREFHWYTMTGLAEFLNSRQELTWTFERAGSGLQLNARHPRSLAHQAWMFPDDQYQQPRVIEGSADIRDQDGYWIAAVKDGKRLKLGIQERQTGTNPVAP